MWFVSIIFANDRVSAFPINSLETEMLHFFRSGGIYFIVISKSTMKCNDTILDGTEKRNIF